MFDGMTNAKLDFNNSMKDPMILLGPYWIGLRESAVPGHFIWQHSSKPLTWSNWKKGEPNNESNEHCVSMYGLDGLQWNDYPCGKNQQVVKSIFQYQEVQDIKALCEYAH